MTLPESKSSFKSGFVTLVGRPNAGKSTLVNALVGHKVAIATDKPQTTRHRLRAIYNSPDMQMVIVDTPGIHKPQDALGEELNRSASKALEDVDVVAMLVDASKLAGRGDEWVARMIEPCRAAKVGVLTKTDLVDEACLAEQESLVSKMGRFERVLSLSALKGVGLDGFISCMRGLLPTGPRWFPQDMDTDQPTEVIVAEFIREKLLFIMRDELPYALGVQVDDIDFEGGLCEISATIYCERESQKGMVIGKGGAVLKKVGTQARCDLERLLDSKVFLNLKVKVKKGWRKDAAQVRRFGYGEGL